ncbi:hypothetical protein BLX87_04695 [Bacillus sp. VT-16-64]|nr:hypothetical protein BLX87_04695 [Bacillus sp. VT-16-64]
MKKAMDLTGNGAVKKLRNGIARSLWEKSPAFHRFRQVATIHFIGITRSVTWLWLAVLFVWAFVGLDFPPEGIIGNKLKHGAVRFLT